MLSGLACQSHTEPDGEAIVERLPLSLEQVKEISGLDKFSREVDTSLVKSTVVVDVSVVALPDAERIASEISQAIIERVN
ncbi:hypothetical protein [Mycobacterium sp. IS-3022]|uniref:hypothetical protein n=1 Tax=Mycobacterium sp. IS-3022 TaxID=1772277 RepID=UPI000741608B|nr:hypothetical protein [Mycobacterium sp. IS-3022]KUH94339.1 hypothetical protein AU188_12410 [Mycobacterium sp. IS-3022]